MIKKLLVYIFYVLLVAHMNCHSKTHQAKMANTDEPIEIVAEGNEKIDWVLGYLKEIHNIQHAKDMRQSFGNGLFI